MAPYFRPNQSPRPWAMKRLWHSNSRIWMAWSKMSPSPGPVLMVVSHIFGWKLVRKIFLFVEVGLGNHWMILVWRLSLATLTFLRCLISLQGNGRHFGTMIEPWMNHFREYRYQPHTCRLQPGLLGQCIAVLEAFPHVWSYPFGCLEHPHVEDNNSTIRIEESDTTIGDLSFVSTNISKSNMFHAGLVRESNK